MNLITTKPSSWGMNKHVSPCSYSKYMSKHTHLPHTSKYAYIKDESQGPTVVITQKCAVKMQDRYSDLLLATRIKGEESKGFLTLRHPMRLITHNVKVNMARLKM